MNQRRKQIEREYPDIDLVFAEGFDEAITGVSIPSFGSGNVYKIIYDFEECVNILEKRDKRTEEEAIEYLEFNTLGSYEGENTPIFMSKA